MRKGASEPRVSLVSLGGHVSSTPFLAFQGSAALERVWAFFRARRLATSADRMGYEGSDGLALPRDCWRESQRRNQRCGLIRPSHPPGRAFPPDGGFRCPVSMQLPPVHRVFARPTNGSLSRQTTYDASQQPAYAREQPWPTSRCGALRSALPRTARRTNDQDMRGLIERRADHLISASTDPTIIVNST